MKETPILMKPAMASATLADIKNETRRIVSWPEALSHKFTQDWRGVWQGHDIHGDRFDIECRFGGVGDRLWVREEHYRYGHWEPVEGVKTKGGKQKWRFVAASDRVLFEAPRQNTPVCRPKNHPVIPAYYKRLARFMPRKLSRITLEIIDLRIERLQDITENAAWREGITANYKLFFEQMPLQTLAGLCMQFPDTNLGSLAADDPKLFHFGNDHTRRSDYEKVVSTTGRGCFAYLWESINGPGSWAKNPFVWVVQYKRIAP